MSPTLRSALRRLCTLPSSDRAWFARAGRRRGREREALFVIVKSTTAAAMAWFAADALVDSEHVAFAPFSALLVVQPSIYRSVLHSGRYVAAVLCGALLAAASGLTVGLHLWSFTLVVIAALVLGRRRVFGQQGTQIPVVAAFALAGGHASQLTELGSLLAMVGLGSVSAIVTTLALAPAVRFKDAKGAVSDFSAELGEFVGDISRALEHGWEHADTGRWHSSARGLEGSLRNARAAVERQEERLPFNPRRFGLGRAPEVLRGSRGWVETLGRVSVHVRSIVNTLYHVAREHDDRSVPADEFLRSYAELLRMAAEVLHRVGDIEDPERTSTSPRIREQLDRAFTATGQTLRAARAGEYAEPERWQTYGALLTDVERVFEELFEGHQHVGP